VSTPPGHPAPFEARLLTRAIPVVARQRTPRDMGVALPDAIAGRIPSPAAAISRAAAIGANPGAAALGTMPRRIVNQRDVECCVSCALAGAMEVRYQHPPLARMFHYHVTRFINGGADGEGRLFLDRGIGTLTAQGICREADHASVFTEQGAAIRPSQLAFDDAVTRRIGRDSYRFRYQPIDAPSRAAEIRRHIREDHPVVITFTLPMNYPRSFLNENDEWLDERSPPPSGSRHCVLVVAFDDARAGGRGAIRIVDSQGTDKFDQGLWWMAYRVVDSATVHEAYALT